jgi:hypothetical protein
LRAGVEVQSGGPPRWRQPEEEPRHDGDDERECQHGEVDVDGLEAWDVSRIHHPNGGEHRVGDKQTGGAADESQHHALSQQLAQQSLPIRPERQPNGDLLLAVGGARCRVAHPRSTVAECCCYSTITALDTVTFTVVPLILVATALDGVCVPARHAARVDPIAALRSE